MIKVEKDFSKIPSILQKPNREEAFNKNVANRSYCDKSSRYKAKSVLYELSKIYHKKCAYCEKNLLDAPKHIEHYRPKSVYYWLAYSWDNLLLCCATCNSNKGVKFDIEGTKVEYNNETFKDIQNLGSLYDSIEKPLLINPEKDDFLNDIYYTKTAKIDSNNKRVKYTIETCNLNREELRQLREIILNDFLYSLNEAYLLILKNNNIEVLIPTIKRFLSQVEIEKEFFTYRKFIVENIDIYIDDILLQRIVQKVILKFYHS